MRARRLFQDVRILKVPPEMPPGKAYFEVGLFRSGLSSAPGGQDRIDIVDQHGQAVGDRVDLGTVGGAPPEQADLSGLRPLAARFEERIELAGWQAAADPAEPSKLRVDLGWRALDRSVTDYTAFVHVLDGDGRIVAQHDQPPGGDATRPPGGCQARPCERRCDSKYLPTSTAISGCVWGFMSQYPADSWRLPRLRARKQMLQPVLI